MSDPDDSSDPPSDVDDPESLDDAAIEMDEAAAPDDDALGQDEIDDLFGISMGEEDQPQGLEALINNAAVRHHRLPLLDACIDRLLRSLTNALRKFTLGNIELSLADSTSIRFGNYIDSVPLPTLISIYKVAEWDGCGLITIDSPLIYSIIDVLLGGSNTSKPLAIEGRSFTRIESMLIERLIKLILDEMTAAFKPLSDVHFQHQCLESNPSRAMIAHPSDRAVLFKVDVDMHDRGGCFEILIPYATLEPVSSLLHQMFMGEQSAQASIWEAHLAGETLMADSEIEVVLGERTVPLRTIMELEVGKTLELNSKREDLVSIRCGDTHLLRGKVGRVGDSMAVMIDDWLSPKDRRMAKNRHAGEQGA